MNDLYLEIKRKLVWFCISKISDLLPGLYSYRLPPGCRKQAAGAQQLQPCDLSHLLLSASRLINSLGRVLHPVVGVLRAQVILATTFTTCVQHIMNFIRICLMNPIKMFTVTNM